MGKKQSHRPHVVPLDDTYVHVLSENCWCFPLVQKEENGKETVIHNAQDTREKYERIVGEGLPDKPWANIFEDMTVRDTNIRATANEDEEQDRT